jgi:high-affinity iron transporter
MVSSFLITLREGLEAALIVGLTLGVLAKMGQQRFRVVIWGGVAAAILVSLLAAAGLNFFGASLEGAAEEIFEGITMLIAACVLTWMIFWMQLQNRRYQQGIERDVRQAITSGQRWGLFGIAFFAVLREGIETVLFLSAAAMTDVKENILFGGLLGLTAAVVLGWALFASTARLDIRRFFQVTSVLLILFAAGLFAHAVHEFVEVGWLPAVVDPVWDTNPILNEDSPLGSIVKALFGYNGNPSLTEVLAYISYFGIIKLGFQSLQRTLNRVVKYSN